MRPFAKFCKESSAGSIRPTAIFFNDLLLTTVGHMAENRMRTNEKYAQLVSLIAGLRDHRCETATITRSVNGLGLTDEFAHVGGQKFLGRICQAVDTLFSHSSNNRIPSELAAPPTPEAFRVAVSIEAFGLFRQLMPIAKGEPSETRMKLYADMLNASHAALLDLRDSQPVSAQYAIAITKMCGILGVMAPENVEKKIQWARRELLNCGIGDPATQEAMLTAIDDVRAREVTDKYLTLDNAERGISTVNKQTNDLGIS